MSARKVRCYECGRSILRDTATCPHCGAMQVGLCEGCEKTISVYVDTCEHCGHEQDPKRWRAKRTFRRVVLVLLVLALAGYGVHRIFLDRNETSWADFEDARMDFEATRYDSAAIKFEKYLRKYGEDARARYMLGISRFRMGEEMAGVEEARRALESSPDMDQASLFLASYAWREGNLAEALARARQALAHEPRPAEAHWIVGRILSTPAYFDSARAVFHLEKALEGGADDPEIWILLAEHSLATEQVAAALGSRPESERYLAKAREKLNVLLRENPEDADLLLLLARIEYAMGEYGRAYTNLQRAMRSPSVGEDHRILLGKLEWQRENHPGARRIFDDLLKSAAGPSTALKVASAYRELGDADLAAKSIAEGRKRFPGDLPLLLSAARRLIRDGQGAEAVDLLAHDGGAHADNPRLAVMKAEALLTIPGREAEAEPLLRAASAARPHSEASLRLADLLLDTEEGEEDFAARIEEAEDLISAAEADLVEGDPQAVFLGYLRGKLLWRRRHLAAAIEELSSVTSRLPDEAPAHLLLALVHAARGDFEMAAMEYGAVIRLRGATPSLLLERAGALLAGPSGSWRESARDAREALQLDPESGPARLVLARAKLRGPAKERAGLREVLEPLLGQPRHRVAARILLARGIAAGGDFDAALGELRRAKSEAESQSDSYDVTVAMGDVLDAREGASLSTGAREEYERYLASHGGDESAKLVFARALLEKGDVEEARKWAERVLQREPGAVGALRILFDACFSVEREGDYDRKRVSELIAEIGRLAPDGVDLHYARGKLALVEGKPREAIDHLEKASDRDPRDYAVLYLLGLARFRAGDAAKAREALVRCVEVEPRLFQARLLLARVAFDEAKHELEGGRPLEAARRLHFSLENDPNLLGALGLLAQSHFEAGVLGDRSMLDSAEDECRRMIARLREVPELEEEKRNEGLVPALVLLGNICWEKRDWKGVQDACDQLLAIVPDDANARLRKGAGLLASGQADQAVGVLSALAADAPDSWYVRTFLLDAYVGAGRVGEAVEVVKSWIAAKGEDTASLMALARLRRREGDGDRAAAAYRRVLDLDPDLADAADELSLLVGKRDPDAARRLLEELLPRSARKAELTFFLGRNELARDFGSKEGVRLLEEAIDEGFESRRQRAWCTVILLRALVAAGRFEEAAKVSLTFHLWAVEQRDVQAGHRLARPFSEAYCLSGVALARTGAQESAEHRYRTAMRLRESYPEAMNNLAGLLAGLPGQQEEAVMLARRALDLSPGRPEYLDTLGTARLAAGDVEGARESFEAAAAGYRESGGPGAKKDLAASLLRLAWACFQAKDRDAVSDAMTAARKADPAVEGLADWKALEEKLR